MSKIQNKKYIQKVCSLVYRQFIINEDISVDEMNEEMYIYDNIFNFLESSFGHDTEGTDFLYACAYENIKKWGDKISSISPEQIVVASKQKFKGNSSYFESSIVREYYSHNTYMGIMLEYDIRNWNIDPDEEDRDVRDSWDWEVDITTDKNSKW